MVGHHKMEGIHFENKNQRSGCWLGRPTCSYFGVPAGHTALTTRAASVRAAPEFGNLAGKSSDKTTQK
jgi:hypothetical protein